MRAMKRRTVLSGLASSLLSVGLVSPSQARSTTVPYRLVRTEIEVFPDRQPGGFSHFRIPSMVATRTGILMAFCEGRRSRRDHGDTDILFKISVDGGLNWRAPTCIFNRQTCTYAAAPQSPDGNPHEVVIGNTGLFPNRAVNWRNPTAVYADGKVFLFLVVDEAGEAQKTIQSGKSLYTSRFFMLETMNPEDRWIHGISWSAPRELIVDHPYLWGQFGPGRATVHKGRLIVPAATNNGSRDDSMAFALLSDDGGQSWVRSGPAGTATETQITPLLGGGLLMSKRRTKTQDFFVSWDNGGSWSPLPGRQLGLVTPTVQTGLITDRLGKVIVTAPHHPNDRVDLSVYVNDDILVSDQWAGPYPLEPENRCTSKRGCRNTQGYSCPAIRPDGVLVVLYEDSKWGEPYRRLNCAILAPV